MQHLHGGAACWSTLSFCESSQYCQKIITSNKLIHYLLILLLPYVTDGVNYRMKRMEKSTFQNKGASRLTLRCKAIFSELGKNTFWPGINNFVLLIHRWMFPKHTETKLKAGPEFTYFSRLARYSWSFTIREKLKSIAHFGDLQGFESGTCHHEKKQFLHNYKV